MALYGTVWHCMALLGGGGGAVVVVCEYSFTNTDVSRLIVSGTNKCCQLRIQLPNLFPPTFQLAFRPPPSITFQPPPSQRNVIRKLGLPF